ncbi:MAG: DUF3597 domain-containing protein [Gemmatimonadaceae bacterium]|nr:DUF3597 domain-containing protein [Gemmatimonadaceae bacterium]
MSVLGSLMSKIFGHHTAAATPVAPAAPVATAPVAPSAPSAPVDVDAVLSDMAAKSSQKLDWQNSIVDLMKLVGIDSSMVNRRALASELGYTGDMNDSAPMNIWLHKEVMQKMANNDGTVPANLLD